MSNKQEQTNKQVMERIATVAAEAAQAVVKSPSFQQSLVRNLIREAAINPGGFNRRAPGSVRAEDLLQAPMGLSDNSVIALSMFPIDLPTCYTVMVMGSAHHHDHDHHHEAPAGPTPVDGPTEVAEAVQAHTPAAGGDDYTLIVYRDVPGNAFENHIVQLTEEENAELQRQFRGLGVAGVKWYYITKLELKDAEAK
jgi:hypothetical protein